VRATREMHLSARDVHTQAKIYQVGKLPKVRAAREMHLPARDVHTQAKIYQVSKLPKVRFSFLFFPLGSFFRLCWAIST